MLNGSGVTGVVEERRLVVGRGCGLTPVDRVDPVGARVVVDEEPASPDARRVGLGDTERGSGRDGRVGGVAAGPQHVDADLARDRVDARDRPTGARHHRDLRQVVTHRRRAAVAGSAVVVAGRGARCRGGQCRDDAEGDPGGHAPAPGAVGVDGGGTAKRSPSRHRRPATAPCRAETGRPGRTMGAGGRLSRAGCQGHAAVGDEHGRPGELDPVVGEQAHGEPPARDVDEPRRTGVERPGPEARRDGRRAAPVPQERVSPTPRSWTRIATWPGPIGRTSSTFVPCGGSGRRRAARARSRTSRSTSSGSATTVCGLPRSTDRAEKGSPSPTWTRASKPSRSAVAASASRHGPRSTDHSSPSRRTALRPGPGGDDELVASRGPRGAGTRRRRACRCRTSRPPSRRRCGSP